MTFLDDEILVREIAGDRARVQTSCPGKKRDLSRLGFIEKDDYLTRTITNTDDRRRLLESLIDLDALFSYGRDWCPSELVEYYRDLGLLARPFRIIVWRDPDHYTISTR
jgi:hypothetical protein